MKKLISTVLTIVMIFCLGISAYAEPKLQNPVNNDIAVYYLYTDSVSSTISISNKTATCKSLVYGVAGTTTKIEVTQTLQKKNGNSWDKVSNWNKTYNTWLCNYVNSKSSLSGGTYRVKTVAKVYSSTKYETVTSYSKEVSC